MLVFLRCSRGLKQIYDNDPEKVATSAKNISKFVTERLENSNSGDLPDESSLHIAINFYKERFDKTYGGMSGQPKFPSSFPNRLFLSLLQENKRQKVFRNGRKDSYQNGKWWNV